MILLLKTTALMRGFTTTVLPDVYWIASTSNSRPTFPRSCLNIAKWLSLISCKVFFSCLKKGSGSEALSWHTPTKTSRKVPHLSPSPHTQNRKATSMGKSSREARVRKKDGLNFSAHVTDAFSMADQKRLYRGLCPSLTHFLSAMRSTRLWFRRV